MPCILAAQCREVPLGTLQVMAKSSSEERNAKILKEGFDLAAEKESTEMISIVALIRLLIFTGCRLGEILTLKWEYVDIDNHCLRLPDSKTGAKIVYLSPPALETLNDIKAKKDNPYVITGRIEGMHLINPQKAWQRIRIKAQLQGVRIHDLRHSFASIGAASGLSLPIIGALLGHKQTQTTARYAHLIGDPLKQATGIIGDKIKAAMAERVEHLNIKHKRLI